jgi:hypothetical protein
MHAAALLVRLGRLALLLDELLHAAHVAAVSKARTADSLVVLALLVDVPLVLALPWQVVGLVAADVEGDEEAAVSELRIAGGGSGQWATGGACRVGETQHR